MSDATTGHHNHGGHGEHHGHDEHHGHEGHEGHGEHHGHEGHEGHGEHSHSHSAGATDGAASADDIAECPVMPGSTILKADAEAADLVREYEGNRYYLCCSACGPLFDADPAKYAAAN